MFLSLSLELRSFIKLIKVMHANDASSELLKKIIYIKNDNNKSLLPSNPEKSAYSLSVNIARAYRHANES